MFGGHAFTGISVPTAPILAASPRPTEDALGRSRRTAISTTSCAHLGWTITSPWDALA
jgi:hypothetical protein